MKIEKIYFDMDGVLADFERGMEELCNYDMNNQSEGPQKDTELWDAVRTVDCFFDKLEPIQIGVEMFRILYEKYGDKCEILTAIPKPFRNIPNAREDKINWVKRLLSDQVVVNVVYREEKQAFVTNKNCILIDDYILNIDEWNNAGGTGILFNTADNTLDRVLTMERG